jgi:DNA-binding LacI/PurR family transcriptional regulator
MASLSEVARSAGVSITTASRVLNQGKYAERISADCAHRVREAAKVVGYIPNYHARSMKLGRAETVAFALDVGRAGGAQTQTPPGPMGHAYFQNLISGMEAVTHFAGYNLLLIGPSPKMRATDRALRGLLERRLDGFVLPGLVYSVQKASLVTEGPDLPIVVIQPLVETPLPTVDFDDEAGIRMMVRHLIELGHRDLLWLGPVGQMSHARLREQAFMTEVWDAQLRGSSCRFDRRAAQAEHTDVLDPNDLTMIAAEEALAKLLAEEGDRRKWTAIVCYNDLIALGATRALTRVGLRIPQDVSVGGFDNAQAPFATPPLTTIDHKLFRMGQRAGELLLEMATGGETARQRLREYKDVIQPELIVRASTGPAPTAREGQ